MGVPCVPRRRSMEARETDSLMRMMLGMLLFRLGGEQTFTLDEYEYIRGEVKGVQIFAATDGTITLRTRGATMTEKAMEEGNVI